MFLAKVLDSAGSRKRALILSALDIAMRCEDLFRPLTAPAQMQMFYFNSNSSWRRSTSTITEDTLVQAWFR